MKVCVFETMNLSVPMLDIGGTLYTSSAVLAEVFGIDTSSIRSVVQRNKDRFSGSTLGDVLQCVSEWDVREMKETLRVKQLKKATVLWSHRDLIHLGLLLTGDTARAFQEDVIDLIERQARVNYVPKEMLDQSIQENTRLADLIGRLTGTLEEYGDRIQRLEEGNAALASHAGAGLRLVRDVKPLLRDATPADLAR